MKKEEAIQIIEQATSLLRLTKQEHGLIQEALETLNDKTKKEDK